MKKYQIKIESTVRHAISGAISLTLAAALLMQPAGAAAVSKKDMPAVSSINSVSLLTAVGAGGSVRISQDGQTVDTLNGVPAQYIMGTGNSNTGPYSCAGYVKKYYSKIYGVDVFNLLTGAVPKTSASGRSFSQIHSNFQQGDIVYQTNSGGSGHWMIAKSVSGNQITVIEQNWKWKSGSSTMASVNRVITIGSTPNAKVFRLNGQSVQPAPAPSGDTSQAALEELLFMPTFYHLMYDDLQQAFHGNEGALRQHWQNHGKAEGRIASPYFDAKFYLSHHPDVAAAYGSENYAGAYNHFVQHGFWEGRQGSQVFSSTFLLNSYPDLKNAFGNHYLEVVKHFQTYGAKELRKSSAQFNLAVYSAGNPDVTNAFPDPMYRIMHYIRYVQYGNEHRTCV